MPSASFQTTLRKELFHFRFIVFTLFIAICYILISLYGVNYRLVLSTLWGTYPLSYKFTLLFALLGGAWTAFTPLDFGLVIIDGLLVGANLALLIKSMRKLRNQGVVEVSIGGATILGLATAGCSSCGFSLLAIMGVSSSFSFLPFKGLELHLLSTILLAGSFIYMLSYLHKKIYCRLPKASSR